MSDDPSRAAPAAPDVAAGVPAAPDAASAPGAAPAAAAPAAPQASDPRAELRVSGSANFAGDVRGKGELTLFLSDAARAKVALDYRGPEHLLLSVESEGGIRLSADDSLVLSGGLTRDLLNGEVGGSARVRLRIARDVAADVRQQFGSSGARTSVSVTVRF